MAKPKIEKRTRIAIGVLAIISAVIFLSFTFGNTTFTRLGVIATGITLSLAIYSETAIVTYFKSGKYKSFTGGDVVVIFGAIVATAVLFYSLSLIPEVGSILPNALIEFTTPFARVIAVLAVVVTGFFMATDKFQ